MTFYPGGSKKQKCRECDGTGKKRDEYDNCYTIICSKCGGKGWVGLS